MFQIHFLKFFISCRFERDIEYMINEKPGLYWRICWKYLAPIFIIVVFFASLIGMMVNGISYQRWDVLEVGLYYLAIFVVMLYAAKQFRVSVNILALFISTSVNN